MLISICLGHVVFVSIKFGPEVSNTDFITWLVYTLIDGTKKEEKNVANCKTKVYFEI